MPPEPQETTTAVPYKLTCTDCAFETTVDGDGTEALAVADAHQAEHGDSPMSHFVDCRLTEGE